MTDLMTKLLKPHFVAYPFISPFHLYNFLFADPFLRDLKADLARETTEHPEQDSLFVRKMNNC